MICVVPVPAFVWFALHTCPHAHYTPARVLGDGETKVTQTRSPAARGWRFGKKTLSNLPHVCRDLSWFRACSHIVQTQFFNEWKVSYSHVETGCVCVFVCGFFCEVHVYVKTDLWIIKEERAGKVKSGIRKKNHPKPKNSDTRIKHSDRIGQA